MNECEQQSFGFVHGQGLKAAVGLALDQMRGQCLGAKVVGVIGRQGRCARGHKTRHHLASSVKLIHRRAVLVDHPHVAAGGLVNAFQVGAQRVVGQGFVAQRGGA